MYQYVNMNPSALKHWSRHNSTVVTAVTVEVFVKSCIANMKPIHLMKYLKIL